MDEGVEVREEGWKIECEGGGGGSELGSDLDLNPDPANWLDADPQHCFKGVRVVIDYADTVDTRFARKRKTRKTVFAFSYGAQFFLF